MSDPSLTALDILERLVSFDTTSSKPNLEIIAWIEGVLARHGVASFRHDLELGSKTNLYATIGPADRGGILLSGHTDVVPVAGQHWTTDPFRLSLRDGRAYGRGTCDMKGFLAVVLAALPEMTRHPLRTPIHLAFSCDEEIGSTGVIPLVRSIAADGPMPRMAIVGEPSMMEVITTHKELRVFATEITGRPAHSSDPSRGVNAIGIAVRLAAELEAIANDFRAAGDPTGLFQPPFSTLNVGVINGGTAMNIVAEHCRIDWEMRLLPGFDPTPALDRLAVLARRIEDEALAAGQSATIVTRQTTLVPGLAAEPGSTVEKLVMRLAHRNDTSSVAYGTEAGHFQGIGIPTVICGPGSIAQAHRADEFIALSELDRCADFLRDLIDFCATTALDA